MSRGLELKNIPQSPLNEVQNVSSVEAGQANLLSEFLADEASDSFGYEELSSWVAKLIVEMQPPFVYAICGGWGSGKSSFLGFLAKHLSESVDNPLLLYHNAWRASINSDALISFVTDIQNQVSEAWPQNIHNQDSEGMKTAAIEILDEAVDAVSDISVPTRVLGLTYKGLRKALRKDLRSTIRAEEKIRASFQKLGENLFNAKISPFIIIDELDRCTPSSAIRIIESTRMLFSGQDPLSLRINALRNQKKKQWRSPFRFLISFDVDFVCRAFASEYGISFEEAQLYLDKFIQAKYHFPAKTWDLFVNSSVNRLEKTISSSVTHNTACYTELIELLRLETPRAVNRAIGYMGVWNIRDNSLGKNAIAEKMQNFLIRSEFAENLKTCLSAFYLLFGALVVKYPHYVNPFLRSNIIIEWLNYEMGNNHGNEFKVRLAALNQYGSPINKYQTTIPKQSSLDHIIETCLNIIKKHNFERMLREKEKIKFLSELKQLVEIGFESHHCGETGLATQKI